MKPLPRLARFLDLDGNHVQDLLFLFMETLMLILDSCLE